MIVVRAISQDEILKVHKAAISAGLADSRDSLLGGVDRTFVAGIPRVPSHIAQILSDLTEMNRVGALSDESVPLAMWLRNAIALSGLRQEANIFQCVLMNVQTLPTGALAPPPRPSPAAEADDEPGSVERGAELVELLAEIEMVSPLAASPPGGSAPDTPPPSSGSTPDATIEAPRAEQEPPTASPLRTYFVWAGGAAALLEVIELSTEATSELARPLATLNPFLVTLAELIAVFIAVVALRAAVRRGNREVACSMGAFFAGCLLWLLFVELRAIVQAARAREVASYAATLNEEFGGVGLKRLWWPIGLAFGAVLLTIARWVGSDADTDAPSEGASIE